MKHIITIFAIVSLFFALMPVGVFADSPPATLTIDGVPAGTFPSVQAAVDAVTANPGTNFVIEIASGTVTDPLNIVQQPGKNVVIRPQAGATVTFTNTINIDGNGNLNSPETLLIEGLNFDLSDGTVENCIYFVNIPPNPGFAYPHNITINGCTFRGIFGTTVVVQSVPGGSRNIAIMNSTATNVHSLAQLKAVNGYAFIQNCTVSNAENGVNFYGPGDLIIDSSKFDVVGYAVRSGQNVGVISNLGSVTINNSVLNSSTADEGTVVLRGDSTSNINIIHSNITNAASGGPFLQNLNAASFSLYDIDLVESNLSGEIEGIDTATIAVIDAPNVPNGPVNISGNGNNTSEILLIVLLSVAVILLLFVIFGILGDEAAEA